MTSWGCNTHFLEIYHITSGPKLWRRGQSPGGEWAISVTESSNSSLKQEGRLEWHYLNVAELTIYEHKFGVLLLMQASHRAGKFVGRQYDYYYFIRRKHSLRRQVCGKSSWNITLSKLPKCGRLKSKITSNSSDCSFTTEINFCKYIAQDRKLY